MPCRDLRPRLLEIDDAEALFNVNAPEDLLHAAADARSPNQPKVKLYALTPGRDLDRERVPLGGRQRDERVQPLAARR